MSMVNEWGRRLEALIWDTELEQLPRGRRLSMRLLRLGYVIGRDLNEGQLNLRAMSLVYTTLLSLVPLLAFSFSVLKGLGVHNRLEPLLFEALETLGPRGQELGERIMGFVENVRADLLGSIGLALLIYLIVSLVQKIENAFNHVWHVRQSRSIATRFSNYLSVIMIGPLLITAALGITATVADNEVVEQLLRIEPLGTLVVLLSHIVPYLIVIGVFTFVYIFMPNTRVRFWPALAGGALAGLVWQTTGWVFANFVANSGQYIAIYSSFAIVLTFMIWLYLNWLILLIGAQVGFYVQNPRFIVKSRGRLTLSNELRERLALEIMYRVGRAFHRREALWDIERLSAHLRVPSDMLATVTDRLERCGLLLVTDAPGACFVPGADLDSIAMDDIRFAVRRTDPKLDHDERQVPISGPVALLAADMDTAARERLAGRTLRDVVTQEKSEEE